MSAVTPRLFKAEDFWLLPENGMRRALVRREVIETMPPGGQHGVIALELAIRLREWTKSGREG
jgi:Uma2 family endonuclease